MNTKERAVFFAALLHDIGKIEERRRRVVAHERYVHARYGSELVDTLCSGWSELDTIHRLIRVHHTRTNDPEEAVVRVSDFLASGERVEEQYEPRVSELRLRSIFSRVFEDEENFKEEIQPVYFKRKVLEVKDHEIFQPHASERVTGDELSYEALWEKFQSEWQAKVTPQLQYSNVSLFEDPVVHTVYHLLYKYFWAVPAAKRSPDISLFDHLRIAGAVAIALMRGERYSEIVDIEDALRQTGSRDCWRSERLKQPAVILLKGDISGVQKFISNVPSKGAAKSLKGRSLYLWLLERVVPFAILRDMGLPIANLLYAGGGNFYLILPYSEEVKAKIEEWRERVNEILLHAHKGELYIALAYTGVSFCNFMVEGGKFSKKWGEVSQQAASLKARKFSELNLGDKFDSVFGPFDVRDGCCEICKFGGRLERLEELELCSMCKSLYDLPGRLKSAKGLEITLSVPIKPVKEIESYQDVFHALGIDLEFTERKAKATSIYYTINDTEFEGQGFIFVPTGIPMKEGRIKSFEELAADSEGAKLLGIYKGDVDNLGKIFSRGLGRFNTLSRVATLSRMMDMFFSGYVNTIRDSYKDHVYLIFSGGDDTLAFGAWDKLYEWIKELRGRFNKFVSNRFITLSSSYHVFDPKHPVINSTRIAEGKLEEAKHIEEARYHNRVKRLSDGSKWEIKNRCTIMGVVVDCEPQNGRSEFDELNRLLDMFEEIKTRKDEDEARRVVRRVIRATIGFGEVTMEAIGGKVELSRVWRFDYLMREEVKDEQIKDIIEELRKKYREIVVNALKNEPVNPFILGVAARLFELKVRREV